MNPHHESLVNYVMANSPRNREQAMTWLDQHTRWRQFDAPPVATTTEMEDDQECLTD